MTTYKTIFARSFSQHEQKKMGYGALMGCFLMAFTISIVFKPCLGPLSLMDLEQSMASGLKMLMNAEEISEQPQPDTHVESVKTTVQNLTNSRSQVYDVNGDIRIHGNSSTIFIASSVAVQLQNHPTKYSNSNWTIKPYARKGDKVAMARVRTFKIINQRTHSSGGCRSNFDSVPAIVFSIGGYTGNLFHDFTDVLIPLYFTSQQFNTTVIFLVSQKRSWWTSKYKLILKNLSKFNVIDIDKENELLCFQRMIVGLKANVKELGAVHDHPSNSIRNFTKFLRNTYSLDRGSIKNNSTKSQPRLLIISRKKTRHMRNEGEVAELARSLGFEVFVREMGSQVSSVAKFVNKIDVMVGVHGAGITNMVYLPENAVVIQIIPLGLEDLAKHDFQIPAKDMNLRHLEYKVSVNESSLFEKYGNDDEVFREPASVVHNKGWHAFRSVYLDNQDVILDLVRFKKTLLKARELVCT